MASASNPFPSPDSTTTTPITSSTSVESVIPLNIPISTKLSDSNFPTWQSQILPLLHGYNLARFIDSPPPDSTLMNSSGAIEVNPAYLPWHRQDQLLLGWIRSSLNEQVQAEVVSCTTTRHLWLTLQRNYASTAKSRVTSLKRQIQSAQKGSLSCSAYLTQIRRVADELAFIGASIPEEELVTYAINGLGVEFNPVVAAINAVSQHSPFSFSELRSLLLSHEAMLHSQDLPAAFYTGKGQSRPQTFGSQQSRPPFFGSQPLTAAPSQAQSTKPTCQICLKVGHSANLCYRRYDKDPNWIPNPRRTSPNPAQAFAAQTVQHMPPSTQWILDSGANHHVTNDLNNLSSFFSYDGGDKLHIGNGSGLGITHIGSTSFLISDHSISLCDVLYVPNFSTNLLSISKLLHDNPNLSINFFSSYCVFKDHHTKSTLLQVPSSNGLFSFPVHPSFQALHATRTSTNTWHARLGHPSHSTTLHLIDSFSLPCTSNKFDLCHEYTVLGGILDKHLVTTEGFGGENSTSSLPNVRKVLSSLFPSLRASKTAVVVSFLVTSSY